MRRESIVILGGKMATFTRNFDVLGSVTLAPDIMVVGNKDGVLTLEMTPEPDHVVGGDIFKNVTRE